MALNPPVGPDGQPLRLPTEHFILQREHIDFEVKIDTIGKLKGKGRLILTTQRMVLINDRGNKNDKLKTFDLPLVLMFNEKFEQPIFGANYFTGTCKPLQPGSLPSDPVFKIWFMNGGCTKFLKCIRFCIRQLRENAQNPNFNLTTVVQTQQFRNDLALFDPSDPATIFVAQPVASAQVAPQQPMQGIPAGQNVYSQGPQISHQQLPVAQMMAPENQTIVYNGTPEERVYMDWQLQQQYQPMQQQQPQYQQAPMGPPMGQAPMGHAPMGHAPMGQAPMGQAPMGQPVGQAPMGPPMGQQPMGQYPQYCQPQQPQYGQPNPGQFGGGGPPPHYQ